MLEKFNKYLVASCCCSTEKQFLLAVSGGIDSVVMAHLFHSARLNFAIAHCNFQLRGDESEADQNFVEVLSNEMQVSFHVVKFNTSDYANKMGISVQMAARNLRYNWFEEIASQYGYEYIAVGHNKNDIIETMLLNLARGTGIRGLMGIRPVNKKIIRPILFASRLMIVNYANDHELKWRDDSSNSETKYQRNKIRHTIIPAFETLNQAFIQNALNTAKRIEQTGKLFDLILKQVKESVWSEQPDRILINLEKLKEYPAHDMILFELLKDFGAAHLSQDMLLHTIESVTGKQFHTHSHTFTRDRENLIITSRISKESTETIIDRDTMILNYPIRLYFNNTENLPGFRIPHDRNIAALDADKINYPLLLRGWKKGDRFYPLGLKGSKKISDFLINIKLPLPDKKHVWILESEGKIVWLVNHRIDNRFKVTPETRKILLIDYKE